MPEPRTLFVEAAPASSQEQLAALRVEYIEVFGTHATGPLASDAQRLHARIQSAKSSCEHYLPYIWSEIARVSSFARRLGFDNTIRLLTRFPGALEVVLRDCTDVEVDRLRFASSISSMECNQAAQMGTTRTAWLPDRTSGAEFAGWGVIDWERTATCLAIGGWLLSGEPELGHSLATLWLFAAVSIGDPVLFDPDFDGTAPPTPYCEGLDGDSGYRIAAVNGKLVDLRWLTNGVEDVAEYVSGTPLHGAGLFLLAGGDGARCACRLRPFVDGMCWRRPVSTSKVTSRGERAILNERRRAAAEEHMILCCECSGGSHSVRSARRHAEREGLSGSHISLDPSTVDTRAMADAHIHARIRHHEGHIMTKVSSAASSIDLLAEMRARQADDVPRGRRELTTAAPRGEIKVVRQPYTFSGQSVRTPYVRHGIPVPQLEFSMVQQPKWGEITEKLRQAKQINPFMNPFRRRTARHAWRVA
jgi:hypothetical protein